MARASHPARDAATATIVEAATRMPSGGACHERWINPASPAWRREEAGRRPSRGAEAWAGHQPGPDLRARNAPQRLEPPPLPPPWLLPVAPLPIGAEPAPVLPMLPPAEPMLLPPMLPELMLPELMPPELMPPELMPPEL